MDELLESIFFAVCKILQRSKRMCCGYMTGKKEKYGKTCN